MGRNFSNGRIEPKLLARLSATGQLRTVYIPERAVREWRTLIDFRHRLVAARTRVKNHIKAILQQQGIATRKLWNAFGMTSYKKTSLREAKRRSNPAPNTKPHPELGRWMFRIHIHPSTGSG